MPAVQASVLGGIRRLSQLCLQFGTLERIRDQLGVWQICQKVEPERQGVACGASAAQQIKIALQLGCIHETSGKFAPQSMNVSRPKHSSREACRALKAIKQMHPDIRSDASD